MLGHEPATRAANGDSLIERLAFCIAASTTCAHSCISCADAALSLPEVDRLRQCIRSARVCADVCAVTAKLLLTLGDEDDEVTRCQLRACVAACRACRRECEVHVLALQSCATCATACQCCEQSCSLLAPSLSV